MSEEEEATQRSTEGDEDGNIIDLGYVLSYVF